MHGSSQLNTLRYIWNEASMGWNMEVYNNSLSVEISCLAIVNSNKSIEKETQLPHVM